MRKPNHFKDPNCVEVRVFRDFNGRRTSVKLGHVAAEAAEWLSPLLLGPFRITGQLTSILMILCSLHGTWI